MKRLSIIIIVIILSLSLNVTCFAFMPSESIHCNIITKNIPDNTAYIDMLIPIESIDENYIDYNTENGKKFNIHKGSAIVNYCENGFESYTFHYKNAYSDIKPKYIVDFSCEDSVVEHNKKLFDKIKKYHDGTFNYHSIRMTLDNTELEKNVSSILTLLDQDINYYKKETYVEFFDHQFGIRGFEEFQNKYKKIKFAYLSSDGDILGITNEQNIDNTLLSILLGNPVLNLKLSGNTLTVTRTYGPPIGLAILITLIVFIALTITVIIMLVTNKRRIKRVKLYNKLTAIKESIMNNQYSRTELLIGEGKIYRLKNARVAVFGIGGVGGYTVEALARMGIGHIDLIDSDTVDITNLNRQIIATNKTVGLNKVDVARERINDINPEIKVKTYNLFFDENTADTFDFKAYDYIVDAIDTVSSKILLILKAQENNVPIISCMGTGNKLNAAMLEVSDIYKTSVCPLARVMRYELKKRGVKKLKVVYSKEEPIKPDNQPENNGRHIPGSTPFVPGAAGLIIAGEVLKDLIEL